MSGWPAASASQLASSGLLDAVDARHRAIESIGGQRERQGENQLARRGAVQVSRDREREALGRPDQRLGERSMPRDAGLAELAWSGADDVAPAALGASLFHRLRAKLARESSRRRDRIDREQRPGREVVDTLRGPEQAGHRGERLGAARTPPGLAIAFERGVEPQQGGRDVGANVGVRTVEQRQQHLAMPAPGQLLDSPRGLSRRAEIPGPRAPSRRARLVAALVPERATANRLGEHTRGRSTELATHRPSLPPILGALERLSRSRC